MQPPALHVKLNLLVLLSTTHHEKTVLQYIDILPRLHTCLVWLGQYMLIS